MLSGWNVKTADHQLGFGPHTVFRGDTTYILSRFVCRTTVDHKESTTQARICCDTPRELQLPNAPSTIPPGLHNNQTHVVKGKESMYIRKCSSFTTDGKKTAGTGNIYPPRTTQHVYTRHSPSNTQGDPGKTRQATSNQATHLPRYRYGI